MGGGVLIELCKCKIIHVMRIRAHKTMSVPMISTGGIFGRNLRYVIDGLLKIYVSVIFDTHERRKK